MEPSGGYRTTTLADVEPEQVHWLWDQRLPAGKLTVLDGDPGVGKSTLSVTIAAHISTGRDWPDGSACPKGSVLLLSGEDGLADTVRPRLDAAGGDPSRVHALDAVMLTTPEGDRIERDPHLGDIGALSSAVREHGISLIVVDVLMAFLPSGTDSHKDQDIRGVLRRLKDLAESSGAAVLLLRHLNKSAGGSPMYRGSGSIGINGAARCAMLVARDPEDTELIVLAAVKNNLSPPAPALGYRIIDHFGVGRLEWQGIVDRQASDLLLASSDDDRDERDALAAFLIDYLTDNGGIASAKDCTKAINGAFGPVAKATLKRARDRAGISSTKAGMKDGWLWRLPDASGEG